MVIITVQKDDNVFKLIFEY